MLSKIIVFIIAYFVGLFGFAQIIGSLQNIKTRGIPLTLFTSILWLIITIGTFLVVLFIFNDALIACIIAYIISFIQILASGKIE